MHAKVQNLKAPSSFAIDVTKYICLYEMSMILNDTLVREFLFSESDVCCPPSLPMCVCGLSGSVFMDGADGILSFHHENRPWEIRHTGGGSHARARGGVPKK